MILEQKLEKLAHVMIHHSVKLKEHETLRIICYGFEAMPLVEKLYKEALLTKAKHVHVQFSPSELSKIFYENTTSKQRQFVTPLEQKTVEFYDKTIQIVCDKNPYELSTIDKKRMYEAQKAHKHIHDIMINKVWCLFYYPTNASAILAKQDLTSWQNFVFDASLVDWEKEKKKQEKLITVLKKVKEVHVVGKGTDIVFGIHNQPWRTCAGTHNLPDGEVFTSPIRDQVNGTIAYNTPTVYQSKEFNHITLTFKNGKVTKIDSENKKALDEILSTDDGAKFLGEFAFGLNTAIITPTKQIIFDEKMNKSIHTALGKCYDEAPNGNDSVIHWDLIFRFEPANAKIFFDDILVYDTKKWVDAKLIFLNN
jgi:aminopeptidase